MAGVSYLKQRKRQGATHERVSSELGVASWTLSRWVRDTEDGGVVVPVEVTEAAEAEESTKARLSLLTPRGYRVEGLSEESVIRLVERLG